MRSQPTDRRASSPDLSEVKTVLAGMVQLQGVSHHSFLLALEMVRRRVQRICGYVSCDLNTSIQYYMYHTIIVTLCD